MPAQGNKRDQREEPVEPDEQRGGEPANIRARGWRTGENFAPDGGPETRTEK